MSSDDTTLVIGFRFNVKKVCIVNYVKVAENFEDYTRFLYFLEDIINGRRLKVTPDR